MIVYIEPQERGEALDAYRDRLTPSQIEEIEDAPESSLVRLIFGADGTKVMIIEEG